jgi:hypothetical protein
MDDKRASRALQAAEIEVLRQNIPTTEIDDGAMPRLAVAVAIGFDHARIFAFHALADRCSDYTQMRRTTFFIARPALD